MTRTLALALSLAGLAGLAALGGCASLNNIESSVATYSRWPDARQPATYAFERLPSQQAQPQQQQMLEDSARQAIESAGFRPAADGTAADVSVQLGVRVTASERAVWDDPLWYGGFGGFNRFYGYGYGYGYGRFGRYGGPGFGGWGGWRYTGFGGYNGYGYGGGFGGGFYGSPYYEREVAVLIRDRRSGEPLYETSAYSDGVNANLATVLPAMFTAALQGFPNAGAPNPRRVSIQATPSVAR